MFAAVHDAIDGAIGERGLFERVCAATVEAGGHAMAWVRVADNTPVVSAGREDRYAAHLVVGADTDDPASEPTREEALRCGYASSIAVPISIEGRVAATLDVVATERDAFDGEEAQLLTMLARSVGHAWSAMRAREREHLSAAQAAEAERASRAKDEFLASMSHELRTPLNGVLGLAEALQEGVYGQVNRKQHAALVRIEESGRHLLSLINDLLDVAKVESGKVELSAGRVDIHELVVASVRLVREGALHKNLEIAYDATFPAPWILGDERRLKQVVVNLLSNAVKFTPNGGRLGVEVSTDDAMNSVKLVVWDTGIGIAEEQLPRLFQAFVQLDQRLARPDAGTGLGLALVKGLVELHGGSVSVTSTVGEGSRFTIVLPSKRSPQSSPPPPSEPPSRDLRARAVFHGTRILVADHDETNRAVVADFLQGRGFDVRGARDGHEVVALAREHTPALILMNIQLPRMDGLAAIRALRAIGRSDAQRVAIIAASALATPDDEERCRAAGADDYVTKPISLRHLLGVVEKWLTPQGGGEA